MEFQADAKVINSEGDVLGHVDRVVLDPKTKEVTHLVVRKGTFYTTDRVLPVKMVAEATAERVLLLPGFAKTDLENMPEFEDTEYLLADEQDLVNRPQAGPPRLAPGDVLNATVAPAMVWYPTSPGAMSGYSGMGALPYVAADTDYVTQTRRNIPENTVGLKEGARVNSADGRHVGDVERVFVDEGSMRATHLLISTGLIFKTHTPIPVTWIDTVTDNEITLAVSEKLLKGLPEYKE